MLVPPDHPALSSIAEEVKKGEDISGIIYNMRKACRKGKGVGLAANQIGVLKRIILVRDQVIINPEILSFSEETAVDKEGCLSYPGVFVPIERPIRISVHWYDQNFVHLHETFDGFTARIWQHEVDHLNGICKVGESLK